MAKSPDNWAECIFSCLLRTRSVPYLSSYTSQDLSLYIEISPHVTGDIWINIWIIISDSELSLMSFIIFSFSPSRSHISFFIWVTRYWFRFSSTCTCAFPYSPPPPNRSQNGFMICNFHDPQILWKPHPGCTPVPISRSALKTWSSDLSRGSIQCQSRWINILPFPWEGRHTDSTKI